jgi:surface antigen
MKKCFIVTLILINLCFSGCLSDFNNMNSDQHKRQKIGTIAGAASGAFIGSQMIGNSGASSAFGAIFGGIIGGALGNRTGAYLDAKTQAKINQNAYYALNHGRTGQSYSWTHGDFNGNFVPTRDFYFQNQGLYCREFYQTINIGGKQERAFGKACQMPDGTWKIMN